MKITKNATFNHTLVEMSFKILGFIESIKWKGKLNNKYMKKMKNPYKNAFVNPFFLSLLPLVKKLTVSGIIGNSQGVSKAINPPMNPSKMIFSMLDFATSDSSDSVQLESGALRSMLLIGKIPASDPEITGFCFSSAKALFIISMDLWSAEILK